MDRTWPARWCCVVLVALHAACAEDFASAPRCRHATNEAGQEVYHLTHSGCIPCSTSKLCRLFCDPESRSYKTFTNPECVVESVKPRIKLITAMFSRQNLNGKRHVQFNHLPLFIKSAEHSGVDVEIVGDLPTELQATLPRNVHFTPLTWNELCARVATRALGQAHADRLAQAPHYKVIDIKPLYGVIFSDLLIGYDFWGHIDNDLMLGNIRKLFPHDILLEYDVIPGWNDLEKNYTTWGPFTLYRNEERVNTLFRRAHAFNDTINNAEVFYFDEWGGESQNEKYAVFHPRSMSYTISHHLATQEQVKLYTKQHEIAWDNECVGLRYPNSRCLECNLTLEVINGVSENRLIAYHFPWMNGKRGYPLVEEVAVCHYQFGKVAFHHQLSDLSLDGIMNRLTLPIRISVPGGVTGF